MTDKIKIVGISGSLRKRSFNTALLRAAVELAPPTMEIELVDPRAFPLYDDDLREAGYPPAVDAIRKTCAAAQGFLFVTPEYNFSISGVLKNAIDWLSRPPASPVIGKPLAMMGATPGMGGTMRAQYHLRQMAVFLDMPVVNKPEVFVRNAADMFDEHLKLRDEATKKIVSQLLESLEGLVRRYAT